MKFATAKVLIALTIVWAIACFGYDYFKKPRSAEAMLGMQHDLPSRKDEKATIRLEMKHLCAATSAAELTSALAPVPGLKLKDISGEPSNPTGQTPDCSREVELEVTSLDKLDIMQLDRALRGIGLVADRIAISGLHHYRVEAAVPGSAVNDKYLSSGLEISRGLKSQGHFKWLDSFSVEQNKTVVAYVKYDEPCDAVEILAALNQLGITPFSLVVKNEAERVGGPPPVMPSATP